jgi:hypothetical protein
MAVYLAAASLIFAVNRDERHEFLLFFYFQKGKEVVTFEGTAEVKAR